MKIVLFRPRIEDSFRAPYNIRKALNIGRPASLTREK